MRFPSYCFSFFIYILFILGIYVSEVRGHSLTELFCSWPRISFCSSFFLIHLVSFLNFLPNFLQSSLFIAVFNYLFVCYHNNSNILPYFFFWVGCFVKKNQPWCMSLFIPFWPSSPHIVSLLQQFARIVLKGFPSVYFSRLLFMWFFMCVLLCYFCLVRRYLLFMLTGTLAISFAFIDLTQIKFRLVWLFSVHDVEGS